MANYLSTEKRHQIFRLLCEGSGQRAISRIIGSQINTVREYIKRYYCIADYFIRKNIRDLSIEEIEADEIRTYVKKSDNIKWIYIALDRKSRLVVHFHIGKRDTEDARKFLEGMVNKLKFRSNTNLNTDCLRSYAAAVEKKMCNGADASMNHVFIVRKDEDIVYGRGITNYVERQNGTVRQHVSSMVRRTRCFSKKIEFLYMQLTIHFFYYNFVKTHASLGTTPAIAAGITDSNDWEQKLFDYAMLFTEKMSNKEGLPQGATKKKSPVVEIPEEDQSDFLAKMLPNEWYRQREMKRGPYNKTKIVKIA